MSDVGEYRHHVRVSDGVYSVDDSMRYGAWLKTLATSWGTPHDT